MITVAILIDGHPLAARSAKRIYLDPDTGLASYQVDDGSVIWHSPADGAVALAKKLLDTIKE